MAEVPLERDLRELVDEAVRVSDLELRGWAIIRTYRKIVGMAPGRGKEADSRMSLMHDEYAFHGIERLEKALQHVAEKWKERPEADDTGTRKARRAVQEGFEEYLRAMREFLNEHGRSRPSTCSREEVRLFGVRWNTWNAAREVFEYRKRSGRRGDRRQRRAPHAKPY